MEVDLVTTANKEEKGNFRLRIEKGEEKGISYEEDKEEFEVDSNSVLEIYRSQFTDFDWENIGEEHLFFWIKKRQSYATVSLKQNELYQRLNDKIQICKGDIVHVLLRLSEGGNLIPSSNSIFSSSQCNSLIGVEVKRVVVKNFCNWHNLDIKLSSTSEMTFIFGPNGSGKTCLMKALWFWNYAHNRLSGKSIEKKDIKFTSNLKDLFHKSEESSSTFEVTIYCDCCKSDESFETEEASMEKEIGYTFTLLGNSELTVEKKGGNDQVQLAVCFLPLTQLTYIEGEETVASNLDLMLMNPGNYLRSLCRILKARYLFTWDSVKEFMETHFEVCIQEPQINQGKITINVKHLRSNFEFELANLASGALKCLAQLVCIGLSRCQLLLLDEPETNLEALGHAKLILWCLEHDTLLFRREKKKKGEITSINLGKEKHYLSNKSKILHHTRPRQFLISTHSGHLLAKIQSWVNILFSEQLCIDFSDQPYKIDFYGFIGTTHKLIEERNKTAFFSFLDQYSLSQFNDIADADIIIYTENNTDAKILLEFANLLSQQINENDSNEFITGVNLFLKVYRATSNNKFKTLNGLGSSVYFQFLEKFEKKDISRAMNHFYDFQRVTGNEDLRGFCIVDSDKTLKSGTDKFFLTQWTLHEIENYIVNPTDLKSALNDRGFKKTFDIAHELDDERILKNFDGDIMSRILSPTKSAKIPSKRGSEFLIELFRNLNIHIYKKDFFHLVKYLQPSQIHKDIRDIFSRIGKLILDRYSCQSSSSKRMNLDSESDGKDE